MSGCGWRGKDNKQQRAGGLGVSSPESQAEAFGECSPETPVGKGGRHD